MQCIRPGSTIRWGLRGRWNQWSQGAWLRLVVGFVAEWAGEFGDWIRALHICQHQQRVSRCPVHGGVSRNLGPEGVIVCPPSVPFEPTGFPDDVAHISGVAGDQWRVGDDREDHNIHVGDECAHPWVDWGYFPLNDLKGACSRRADEWLLGQGDHAFRQSNIVGQEFYKLQGLNPGLVLAGTTSTGRQMVWNFDTCKRAINSLGRLWGCGDCIWHAATNLTWWGCLEEVFQLGRLSPRLRSAWSSPSLRHTRLGVPHCAIPGRCLSRSCSWKRSLELLIASLDRKTESAYCRLPQMYEHVACYQRLP